MHNYIRSKFNSDFSLDKYNDFLKNISRKTGFQPPFRVAETPVFVPDVLKLKLLDAGNQVIDCLCSKDTNALADEVVPTELLDTVNVGQPTCIAIDFAIIDNGNGGYSCQLIELQGAMSLHGFQYLIASEYENVYDIPTNYSAFLSDLDQKSYLKLLRDEFLGKYHCENVVFLEVTPQEQQNYIDLIYLEKMLGIRAICVSEIFRDNNKLYYKHGSKLIPIYRICNRIMYEEFIEHSHLSKTFIFDNEVDVEWVCHPKWFFRYSKSVMPFVEGEYFPDCTYLGEINTSQIDLDEFVLKPVASYGGKDVILSVKQNDINISTYNKKHILQKKVEYAKCIETPSDSVKTEIRLLYVWQEGAQRPIPVISLARLSRGDKMALRYNKDSWTGASVCFFEKRGVEL